MTDDDNGEYVTYNKKPSVTPNDIRDRLFGESGAWVPEISPNYNPNTGRIELPNSKPVGVFDSSSNSGVIAKKWIVKD